MIGDLALGVHIAAGAAGLAIGPIAIRDAVRAVARSRAGETYHWLVAVVALSAVAVALLDWSELWFFVPIAAGSYGFALVGHLAGRRRWGRWRGAYVRGTAGAYIALITAVVVVSVSGSPLGWALPTLVGVPLVEWLANRAELAPTSTDRGSSAPSPGTTASDESG